MPNLSGNDRQHCQLVQKVEHGLSESGLQGTTQESCETKEQHVTAQAAPGVGAPMGSGKKRRVNVGTKNATDNFLTCQFDGGRPAGNLMLSFLISTRLEFPRHLFPEAFLAFHLRSVCRSWRTAMHQHLSACTEKLDCDHFRLLSRSTVSGLSRFSDKWPLGMLLGGQCFEHSPPLEIIGATGLDACCNGRYTYCRLGSRVLFRNLLSGAVLYHSGGDCKCEYHSRSERHTSQWCSGMWMISMGAASLVVSFTQAYMGYSGWSLQLHQPTHMVSEAHRDLVTGTYRIVGMYANYKKYKSGKGAIMYREGACWYINVEDDTEHWIYKKDIDFFDMGSPAWGRWISKYGCEPCLVQSAHDDHIFSTPSTRKSTSRNKFELRPPLDDSWTHCSDPTKTTTVRETSDLAPSMSTVQALLRSEDGAVRRAALFAFAEMAADSEDHGVHEISQFMFDPTTAVRLAAMQVMLQNVSEALMDKHAFGDILSRCTQDSHRHVRSRAIKSLVRIARLDLLAKSKVLQVLFRMSSDASCTLRSEVADHVATLADVGDEVATDCLLSILESAKHAKHKVVVLKALTRTACRGDPKVIALSLIHI